MNAVAIGNKLRDLRGDRRREDVADAIGVGVSTITMYELGERIPKDEIKLRLAKYFERSVAELFYDGDAT